MECIQNHHNKTQVLINCMPIFDMVKKFTSGKRHKIFWRQKFTEIIINENADLQCRQTPVTPTNVMNKSDSESDFYISIQEQLNEQIKSCMAPIGKQLKDLTWLIQRMTHFCSSNWWVTVLDLYFVRQWVCHFFKKSIVL